MISSGGACDPVPIAQLMLDPRHSSSPQPPDPPRPDVEEIASPATRPAWLDSVLPSSRAGFLLWVAAIYLGTLVYADGLRFPAYKDEKHFWDSAIYFSEPFPPSVEQIRNATEIVAPGAFIFWGQIERVLGGGFVLGRYVNLLLSLAIVCAVGLGGRGSRRDSVRAALGLLACPYFLAMGTHLYTDMPAAFFVFAGMWFHTRGRSLPAALCLVLAVACRQYMVAFPVALALHHLLGLSPGAPQWRPALAMGGAAATLFGWMLLFGGVAPQPGMDEWIYTYPAPMLELFDAIPENSLYSLVGVGVYFVLPELLLFRRPVAWRQLPTPWALGVAAGLGVLWLLYPPLPPGGHTGGLFGRAALLLVPAEPLRLALFYALALLAALRFAPRSPGFWIVLAQALVMLKAQIPWEKYALPVLIALWYLRSAGGLDAGGEAPLRPAPGRTPGSSGAASCS